jgi:hypothetical protein
MGILAGALLSQAAQHTANRVDVNAKRGAQAICAIIEFGEETLAGDKSARENPNARQRDATDRFRRLVVKMKATRIKCPPPPNKP